MIEVELRIIICCQTKSGLSTMLPTPRIAASVGLMMGVKGVDAVSKRRAWSA
jgi:hypothetical protein